MPTCGDLVRTIDMSCGCAGAIDIRVMADLKGDACNRKGKKRAPRAGLSPNREVLTLVASRGRQVQRLA